MRLLSSAVCAIGAAVCAAVSAHAAETIAYWPFGTNGFHDVSGNGHDFVGVEVASSDAAYMALNQGTTTNQYLKTAAPIDLSGESAVTIECWCRQTGRPDKTYGVLFSTPSPTVGTGGIILYSVDIMGTILFKPNQAFGEGLFFDKRESEERRLANMPTRALAF